MNVDELIKERKIQRAKEFLTDAIYLLDSPEIIKIIADAIKKLDEQN